MVVAQLDSAPQAFARLEREAVETGQNVIWRHLGPAAYPQDVPHLGLDADWFPTEAKVMTTDGLRLITVSINWPAANAARRRGVAELVARTYLGPLHPPRD